MGFTVIPNLVFLVISLLIRESTAGCSFPQHNAENDELEARIQPLLGKRYTTTDVSGEYLYVIGICTDAVDVTEFPGTNNQHIGVLQIQKVDGKPDFQRSHIIGKYNNAALSRGTDWILLEYKDGDQYHSHCNIENRRARIMITCDEEVSVGVV
ncbi:cation-dependent mannose-6-phosphate receptor-like isoform X2 [Argopecten irradians]|uniref:cation-dependent mannose-6-phosphate receptor-like isoform X2 n=1 Tax=Argopecten irradians TaxID=31199 RepID=UPI00372179BE